MAAVRLDCPLCGATVSDGPPPEPGTCPGCGARYLGDVDAVPQAAEALLEAAGPDAGTDAKALALRLFELDPLGETARRVAITSDRREGFYRWWVFMAEDLDPAGAVRLLMGAGGMTEP